MSQLIRGKGYSSRRDRPRKMGRITHSQGKIQRQGCCREKQEVGSEELSESWHPHEGAGLPPWPDVPPNHSAGASQELGQTFR